MVLCKIAILIPELQGKQLDAAYAQCPVPQDEQHFQGLHVQSE